MTAARTRAPAHRRFGPEAGQLSRLDDGVYAYVQPDGGWCLSNAGVVVGEHGALLVDTAATLTRARRQRQEVVAAAGRAPTIVVNTHHHGDHVFGNQVFAGEAAVVGHELARHEILRAGLGLTRLWPDVDWGDIRLVPPSVTFRDRLRIDLDRVTVELIHVGPAHTTNDVVAWLPERGILFSGDVVLAGATPFCLMGSIEGSLAAIERLRRLGAATVVPGHGPVSGPEVFDATEEYLRWIQGIAMDGVEAGRTPLEAAREADLGAFAALLDSERLVGNLHRAYAELASCQLGEDIEVLRPFQEMVAFHGRLPTCHA